MRYFGGKFRIAKSLAEFLNSQISENQTFVDLFCGSLNIATQIKSKNLILNDKHSYLIKMWEDSYHGRIYPDTVSEDEYQTIKKEYQSSEPKDPALIGFVGFACSFSGKWWGGYCRDNTGRNYAKNGSNSIQKKINKIKDKKVQFSSLNYSEVEIPENSVVYCDIPYKGTTQYSQKEVGSFDHDVFYKWVKDTFSNSSSRIFISEYKENIPDGFKIVWEMDSKKDIRNKNNIQQKTTEVLLTQGDF